MYKIIVISLVIAVAARPNREKHIDDLDNRSSDMGEFAGDAANSLNSKYLSRDAKTRGKRSLLMLLPYNEEMKNEEENDRPIRSIKKSPKLYKKSLRKARNDKNLQKSLQTTPLHLLSWQQVPISKDSMISRLYRTQDDITDLNKNIALVESLKQNLQPADREVSSVNGRTRDKSACAQKKFVCYCQEEDCEMRAPKTEILGNVRAKMPAKTRPNDDKSAATKPFYRRINLPNRPFVQLRLPQLYGEIPYVTNFATAPIIAHDDLTLQRSDYANGGMQILPVVAADIQEIQYADNLNDNKYEDSPIGQYPYGAINGGDEPRDVTSNEIVLPGNLQENDYATTANGLLTGNEGFFNMEECMKLYGRDFCVVSASKNVPNTSNEDEEENGRGEEEEEDRENSTENSDYSPEPAENDNYRYGKEEVTPSLDKQFVEYPNTEENRVYSTLPNFIIADTPRYVTVNNDDFNIYEGLRGHPSPHGAPTNFKPTVRYNLHDSTKYSPSMKSRNNKNYIKMAGNGRKKGAPVVNSTLNYPKEDKKVFKTKSVGKLDKDTMEENKNVSIIKNNKKLKENIMEKDGNTSNEPDDDREMKKLASIEDKNASPTTESDSLEESVAMQQADASILQKNEKSPNVTLSEDLEDSEDSEKSSKLKDAPNNLNSTEETRNSEKSIQTEPPREKNILTNSTEETLKEKSVSPSETNKTDDKDKSVNIMKDFSKFSIAQSFDSLNNDDKTDEMTDDYATDDSTETTDEPMVSMDLTTTTTESNTPMNIVDNLQEVTSTTDSNIPEIALSTVITNTLSNATVNDEIKAGESNSTNSEIVNEIVAATPESDVENSNVGAPSLAQQNLPFCDNTILLNLIKGVINNYTRTDAPTANETLKFSAEDAAKIRNILSLPQVENMIVEEVRKRLPEVTDMPENTFVGSRAGNVIKHALRSILDVFPRAKPKIPAMTVEEHQFRNGKWVTKLVPLVPPTVKKQRQKNPLEKLRDYISNFIEDPMIGLESARDDLIQNLIVAAVKVNLKPEDDMEVDEHTIRDQLRYILNNNRENSELGNYIGETKNDEANVTDASDLDTQTYGNSLLTQASPTEVNVASINDKFESATSVENMNVEATTTVATTFSNDQHLVTDVNVASTWTSFGDIENSTDANVETTTAAAATSLDDEASVGNPTNKNLELNKDLVAEKVTTTIIPVNYESRRENLTSNDLAKINIAEEENLASTIPTIPIETVASPITETLLDDENVLGKVHYIRSTETNMGSEENYGKTTPETIETTTATVVSFNYENAIVKEIHNNSRETNSKINKYDGSMTSIENTETTTVVVPCNYERLVADAFISSTEANVDGKKEDFVNTSESRNIEITTTAAIAENLDSFIGNINENSADATTYENGDIEATTVAATSLKYNDFQRNSYSVAVDANVETEKDLTNTTPVENIEITTIAIGKLNHDSFNENARSILAKANVNNNNEDITTTTPSEIDNMETTTIATKKLNDESFNENARSVLVEDNVNKNKEEDIVITTPSEIDNMETTTIATKKLNDESFNGNARLILVEDNVNNNKEEDIATTTPSEIDNVETSTIAIEKLNGENFIQNTHSLLVNANANNNNEEDTVTTTPSEINNIETTTVVIAENYDGFIGTVNNNFAGATTFENRDIETATNAATSPKYDSSARNANLNVIETNAETEKDLIDTTPVESIETTTIAVAKLSNDNFDENTRSFLAEANINNDNNKDIIITTSPSEIHDIETSTILTIQPFDSYIAEVDINTTKDNETITESKPSNAIETSTISATQPFDSYVAEAHSHATKYNETTIESRPSSTTETPTTPTTQPFNSYIAQVYPDTTKDNKTTIENKSDNPIVSNLEEPRNEYEVKKSVTTAKENKEEFPYPEMRGQIAKIKSSTSTHEIVTKVHKKVKTTTTKYYAPKHNIDTQKGTMVSKTDEIKNNPEHDESTILELSSPLDSTSDENFSIEKIVTNDPALDLENSDLYYVRNDVKLPLELRKLKDGSYALSISKKICEDVLKSKCPCCVPLEGNVVRELKETSKDSHSRENFHDMEKPQTNENRSTVRRSKVNKLRRLNKRTTRSTLPQIQSNKNNTLMDDDSQVFSLPVRSFAKKYNLTLDLDNIETTNRINDADVEARTRVNELSDEITNDSAEEKYDARGSGNVHEYSAEKIDKYEYKRENPIFRKMKFIGESRKNNDLNRYQRDVKKGFNNTTELMTTLLSWLRNMLV